MTNNENAKPVKLGTESGLSPETSEISETNRFVSGNLETKLPETLRDLLRAAIKRLGFHFDGKDFECDDFCQREKYPPSSPGGWLRCDCGAQEAWKYWRALPAEIREAIEKGEDHGIVE